MASRRLVPTSVREALGVIGRFVPRITLSALADAELTPGRWRALAWPDSPTPSTACLGTGPLVCVKMNHPILIGARRVSMSGSLCRNFLPNPPIVGNLRTTDTNETDTEIAARTR